MRATTVLVPFRGIRMRPGSMKSHHKRLAKPMGWIRVIEALSLANNEPNRARRGLHTGWTF